MAIEDFSSRWEAPAGPPNPTPNLWRIRDIETGCDVKIDMRPWWSTSCGEILLFGVIKAGN